jgi:hypothetical protein
MMEKPREYVTSSCCTTRNAKVFGTLQEGKDCLILERDAMFWLIYTDVSEESVSKFSTVYYERVPQLYKHALKVYAEHKS